PDDHEKKGEAKHGTHDQHRDKPCGSAVGEGASAEFRSPVYIPVFWAVAVIEASSGEEGREPGSEANDQPLRRVKRSKENLLCELKSLTKRGEDFDSRWIRFHKEFETVFGRGRKLGTLTANS